MVHGTLSVARSATALLFAIAAACGPQTGTQTNWLRACQTDAQCSAELQCLCGMCTLACEENSSCSELPDAACTPASDAGGIALCGGSIPPTAGLCLLRCEDGACPSGTACVAGVCAPDHAATDRVTVDSAARYQTLVGFGAGTVWFLDEIAQHPARGALYDAMFTDSGLDVIRLYNRYDDFGTSDLTSSVEIMSAATERLGARPRLLLTSTSPPAALKANGSELCSGNPDTCTLARLADGSFDYPGFANHWRAVLEAYAAAGIEPDYISIQNDPELVPPASIDYDACRFLATEGAETVDLNGTAVQVEYPGYLEAVAAVKEALSGLASVPLITAPETRDVETALSFASQLDLANVDVVALHMHETDPSAVDRDALLVLKDLAQRSGLPIFHTEVKAEGLETAIVMHEALSTVGASMYLQNDFVESAFLDVPNPTALIALTETDFTIQDPYHAIRHYARDTDPGWVRVDASSEQGSVLATAWQSPSADAITLVLVNAGTTTAAVEVTFGELLTSSRVNRTVFPGIERSQELGALPPNGVVTLPARSIATVAVRK
jgi:O-glycosyl hydrolase